MIATTIEQSKHLLELGLDPKTADITYEGTQLKVGLDNAITGNLFSFRNGYVIPAWSLSALLEVMPSNIGDYDLYITKHKYVDGGHGYNVEYNRGFTISVLNKGTNRDLVTAAFEMVCWLLEQGLIEKGGEEND